jgi:hypothetical protein
MRDGPVDLLVLGPNGKFEEVTDEKGQTYAIVKPGDQYTLQLTLSPPYAHSAGTEVLLVRFSIDGQHCANVGFCPGRDIAVVRDVSGRAMFISEPPRNERPTAADLTRIGEVRAEVLPAVMRKGRRCHGFNSTGWIAATVPEHSKKAEHSAVSTTLGLSAPEGGHPKTPTSPSTYGTASARRFRRWSCAWTRH